MTVPDTIKAKAGDLVLPKWRALLRFISQTGIVPGPGVRIEQGPNGTRVFAEKRIKPWLHPFRVSVGNGTATVRAGTVNSISPYIGEVNLLGFTVDGEESDVPEIEVERMDSYRSYLAITGTLENGIGNLLSFADTPESLRIEHLADIDPRIAQGGAPGDERHVAYPIAALYWGKDGSFRKVHQIVHHNLNHRFIANTGRLGAPDRHLFWAA